MFYVSFYVALCPFSICNHLDGEERAGCFAKFVFLPSRRCCVALPHSAMGFQQLVIVVFPDHTHLLFLLMCPDTSFTSAGTQSPVFHKPHLQIFFHFPRDTEFQHL